MKFVLCSIVELSSLLSDDLISSFHSQKLIQSITWDQDLSTLFGIEEGFRLVLTNRSPSEVDTTSKDDTDDGILQGDDGCDKLDYTTQIQGTIPYLELQVERLERDVQSLKHELAGDRETKPITDHRYFPFYPPERVSEDIREIFSVHSSRQDPLIVDWSLLPKLDMYPKGEP